MVWFQDANAPWFERPSFEDSIPSSLNEEFCELARRYREDGFLVHDFGFDDALLDACQQATENIPAQFVRQQDMWSRNSAVRKLACHPEILSFLTVLYQRQAFPFQTLNFRVGTQQATHSDSYFFNCFPERFMCGVWVALEDIDLENGPLHYFAGSHALPVYSDAEVTESGHKDYQSFVAERLQERSFRKELGLLQRGQALVWSANLFHGGEPILDKARTRFSQVSHYYFDNCLYYTPVNSMPHLGRVDIREPYDFSRDCFVQSKLGGRTVQPSLRTKLAGRLFKMLRHSPQVLE